MNNKITNEDRIAFTQLLTQVLKSKASQINQDGASSSQTELFFRKFDFKEQFSLYHLKLQEEQKCSVKDLHDILSHNAFKKNLLLASNAVKKKDHDANTNSSIVSKDGSIEHDIESLTITSEDESMDSDCTEANIDMNGGPAREKRKKSTNTCQEQPIINLEERVYSGPICKSPLQFIGTTEQLKIVEGILKEGIIDTDNLTSLSLNDARYLASLYTQCLSNMCKQANDKCIDIATEIPVLVLKCINEAPQNINWLTCNFELCCDEPGSILGYLQSTVITEKSYVTDYENSFRSFMEASRNQTDNVSILYFSRYDLLGSRFRVDDSNENEAESSLAVEFAWREATNPLEAPSLSADAVIKLKVISDDSRSPAKGLFLELSKLDSVIDSIKHGALPKHSIDSEIWLSGQVKTFIQEVSEWRYVVKDANEKEGVKELTSPLESIALEEFKRFDLDFTDKLWDFLRNVVSIDDLTTCLGYVFSAIVSGELQPPLSSTNQTNLAKHIREYYLSQTPNAQNVLQEALQQYTRNSKTALELLADIGIEKVKTDYLSYFINQELATFSQIQPLLDQMTTPSNGISVLMKLNLCLELLIMGKTYLNLKHENLRLLLRSALNYYLTNEATSVTPLFAISVPAFSTSSSTIFEICSKRTPVVWKSGSFSECKAEGINTTSIFMLTEITQIDDDTDPIEFRKSDSGGSYKVTLARDSKVRVF